MSSLVTRGLALALLSCLACPTGAAGQHTEQELVQRLDTLVPLLRSARERAQAARQAAYLSAIEKQIPTETVELGPLKVLVIPGEQAAALDVVGRVWTTEYAPWLDASPALSEGRIFFRWASPEVSYESVSFAVRHVQGPRWRSRPYMEEGVRTVIGAFLKDDLLRTRLGTEWIVPSVRPPADPADIYRRVASAPSHSARDCLAGNAEACLTSFGLGTGEIPVEAWYNQGERYLLVRRNWARFQFWGGLPCIERDYDSCDGALADYWDRFRSAQARSWAVPFDAEVRASLLWFALREGGKGAWGRLLAHADDTPQATLEAASGMPGTELAAAWQRWLVGNRPTRQAGLGSLALGALFWMTLLIALAARSTRWR